MSLYSQCDDCKYRKKDGTYPCKAKAKKWDFMTCCSFYKKKKSLMQRVKDILGIKSPSGK